MDDLISRKAMLSRIAKIPMMSAAKDAAIDAVLDAPAVHYTPYTDIAPITEGRPPDGPYRGELDVDSGVVTVEYPLPDLVEVVRCRDCAIRFDEDACPYKTRTPDNGFCHKGTREEADA